MRNPAKVLLLATTAVLILAPSAQALVLTPPVEPPLVSPPEPVAPVAPVVSEVPPNADLAIVSITANRRHAKIGRDVTFTIVATNNGPDATTLDVSEAAAVVPLGDFRLVSETCDLGISADTPSCEYGVVGPGETRTTTAVLEVIRAEGKFAKNVACVSSEQLLNDRDSQNDCATATIRIVGKRKT
jgi:hypothetical protein